MGDPDQIPEPDTDIPPDNEEDESVIPERMGNTANKDKRDDDNTT